MNLEHVNDPLTRRVLEFVERKGGPSKVARAIGTKPALFYNLESGRAKRPSAETLSALSAAFPDFNSDRVVSGQSASSPGSQLVDLARMQLENQMLKEALSKADAKISELESEVRVYMADFRKMALKDFSESDSQTTANYDYSQNRISTDKPVRRAGFYQERDDQVTDRFHPGIRAYVSPSLVIPRMRCK